MKYYYIFYLLITFLSSCQNTNLSNALVASERNRSELEKVLDYYKGDSLKLEATKFLISNMPGNISYDSSQIYKYRSFLLLLDSLRRKGESEASSIVNKRWNLFAENNYIGFDIYSNYQEDVCHISSEYLIHDIESAFNVWNRIKYRDSLDFRAFLYYILPYRKKNGYIIENWRDYFLLNYGDYIERFNSPHEAVDSLLELVNDYAVNGWMLKNYPYICLRDYNLSRVSKCRERCWFNSMLLSALGVPCAIDFVPAWGNRNSSHEWNAIIVNGKTDAFESTGGIGKWKAKKVYDNVCVDKYWMKSRLPKVFRYTYESASEGPSTNEYCNAKNTPELFLDSKYMDVSQDYFATSTVNVPIKRNISNSLLADYAYICVFNNNKWEPIYWGTFTSDKQVSFKRMGRDQVYLVGIYRNGDIIPLNDPFILYPNGAIHYLSPSSNGKMVVFLNRKYYARPEIDLWRESNRGAYLESSNDSLFKQNQHLFTVNDCASRPNVWMLDKPVKTQYLRYIFPDELDVLAELSFFTKNQSGELSVVDAKTFSFIPRSNNEFTKLFDNDILTYADLNGLYSEQSKNVWVGINLGKKMDIAAFGLCPRNDKNNVIKGLEYELFYWKNNGWVTLGRQIATTYSLRYDNVPTNALLLLKCTSEGTENRIFTWDGEKQIWW